MIAEHKSMYPTIDLFRYTLLMYPNKKIVEGVFKAHRIEDLLLILVESALFELKP